MQLASRYLILDVILDAMLANASAYFRFGYGDGAEYLNKANWVIRAKVPTSWFDSVNVHALFSDLCWLWLKLARRPQGR